MANLKDLIVNGAARVIGKTYSSEFVGNVTGNVTGNAKTATTADKTAYGISVKDSASNLAVNGWNGSAAGNLTIAGTSPITTTATDGKITVSHDNSTVTAGTYKSVTVDAKGHVTAGTNPTTLNGYGITDAKIASGVITLGSNTITPLTSASTLAASKVSGTLATSNIPNLDASKITTGTISVDRLPATALERCVVVADDTARFKLTKSSVQVGDTVKVTATKKMYMVVDSDNLSTEAGYEEYFTSTDWSTITNKPTSFTPATHSHAAATQSANGFMSAADKKKLDGITESADSVSFTRSLTSGTKVGTITINGTGTDLYAPTNTDTHYTAKNVVASKSTGTANVTAATSNPYLNLIENGAVRSTHQIKGNGATKVKTDTSGNIVISSIDTHYTATPVLGATGAVANATSPVSNPYLNIVENSDKSGGIQIKGSGATSVSAVNGIVTISSTDTTYVAASESASGIVTTDTQTFAGAKTFSNTTDSTSTTTGAVKISGGLGVAENIWAAAVHNAVWNDLADCIPVDDECKVEPGYCYCFDGEKYYKSSKYLDEGIVGIDSDTYGMNMGHKPGLNQMDVAVAGFVLAYVDKEYKPGTPLTCTENGYLTEIKREDKIEFPEKIVATYWKNEPADEWGSDSRKVKVNGRKWVKVV